jgi:hypothetical protein
VKCILKIEAEEKKRGVQYASPPPRRPIGWESANEEKPDAA